MCVCVSVCVCVCVLILYSRSRECFGLRTELAEWFVYPEFINKYAGNNLRSFSSYCSPASAEFRSLKTRVFLTYQIRKVSGGKARYISGYRSAVRILMEYQVKDRRYLYHLDHYTWYRTIVDGFFAGKVKSWTTGIRLSRVYKDQGHRVLTLSKIWCSGLWTPQANEHNILLLDVKIYLLWWHFRIPVSQLQLQFRKRSSCRWKESRPTTCL